ncbi:MAG: hypothetical protein M1815_002037 [Lichina confinis]|nr:MAG: hypothetical protein M1815_002037 [Lichina confinis]
MRILRSSNIRLWTSRLRCTGYHEPLFSSRVKSTCRFSSSLPETTDTPEIPHHDHRYLNREQGLFAFTEKSPGSPLFLPHGAHVFNTLISFLRAQHQQYGYEEVITPTIYKSSLWMRSGHWVKYRNDMFDVLSPSDAPNGKGEHEHYALKPMNCPGHCLLYQSRVRGYRELPIRYTDFGTLHRNERSGTLSGLTRARRFHQDDGHIFCMPSQVAQEISSILEFVAMVYSTFRLPSFKLVLSTKPQQNFIGLDADWEMAEAALKEALVSSGREWSVAEGEGAFYGPKIDIILNDAHGREHQTATLQLDFQLPGRLGLEYSSADGTEVPVIIHRAIYGSVERFMALLIEHYAGKWPFWLSPRQAIILTVNQNDDVTAYAREICALIQGRAAAKGEAGSVPRPQPIYTPRFVVDLDDSSTSLPRKIGWAKLRGYNMIMVVGSRNPPLGTLELDITNTARASPARQILSSVLEPHRAAADATESPDVIGDGRHVTIQPQQVYDYFCQLSGAYE